MLPPRDQTAEGVNVTLIVQDDPAATADAVQLLVWEKSPVAMTLLTTNGAVPVLLSMIEVGELLDPTSTPVKLRPTGKSVATGATPTPLIGALCGLPAALSLILTVDDRLPVFVGLKTTLMAQLELVGTLLGQLFVSEKSPELAVEIVIEVIDNDALPVLVSVIICGVLPMPTCWLPKLRLEGDKLTVGCAYANAAPATIARRESIRDGIFIKGVAQKQTSSGGCSLALALASILHFWE